MSQKIYRVWYQSFLDLTQQSPYIEAVQTCLNTYADPAFQFEIHGVSPPDIYFNRLTEFRCAATLIRNAIQAEQQGYDAFVAGHFLEPGIAECKTAVDIPVIGLAEANLAIAGSLGKKIGLVTIHPVFISYTEDVVQFYHQQQRVVDIAALTLQVDDFMRAFVDQASYLTVQQQFIEQIQPLITRGAEVIIPAGGQPMALFAQKNFLQTGEVLVPNGLAMVVKYTEMMVKLKTLAGVTISRAGMYQKAQPESLKEFVAVHDPFWKE